MMLSFGADSVEGDRAKDPTEFWWLVAIYFLGAVLLIGTFLCEVRALSN
jgi:hypothetical protein